LYGYIVPEIGGFETEFSLARFGGGAESDSFSQAFEVYAGVAFGAEEEGFYEKTGYEEGEVEDQLEKGHVFVNEVNVVAGGVGYFEGVVAGAGGGASGVVHFGSGLVGVAVAEDAGAVAQVDVFQVGEMEFVEEAGFLKVFFAVEGGSCAGGENGHGGVVVGGGAAFTYGKCPA